MDSSQLAAGLNFLTDAAHLLRSSVPVVSAYFMRERAERMQHANLDQHELQQQHVCRACGHIMIPGHGSDMSLRPRRRGQKKRKQHGKLQKAAVATLAPQGPTKVLTCGLCSHKTEIPLPPPSGSAAHRRKARASTVDKPGETPNANASSKKRAKMRKAGLQALLSNQQQKSKPSLTLADFVQK